MTTINDGNILRELDEIEHWLKNAELDEVHIVLNRLEDTLYNYYLSLPPGKWQDFILQTQNHPLKIFLAEQDPLCNRMLKKPWGYPGDAELIDFLYRQVDEREIAEYSIISPVGRQINDFLCNLPEARAVLERRTIVIEALQNMKQPLVLSVACGFLREMQNYPRSQLGQLIGMDHEERCIQVLNQYGPPIEGRHLSVHQMLRQKAFAQTKFDMVYSLGLFDYLAESFARRVIEYLFTLLRDGGEMYIANFLPNRGRYFREWIGEWYLIHRSEEELLALASSLKHAKKHVFIEKNGIVGILILKKEEG